MGISYEDLSAIFVKKSIKGLTKQKLDSYMVSNYCCKLAKRNFVHITFQNVKRIAIDVRYNKVALESLYKKQNGENNQANLNTEEVDDQKQLQKSRLNSTTPENIIDYLNKETFTVRELTQRQNIVLNLQSQYAQKNEGLTTKEICLKIRMLHEKESS